MTSDRAILPVMANEDDDVPDDVFDAFKEIANEIERRRDAGTLSKDQLKRLKAKAKQVAGKWWGELAEAIESLKP